MHRWIIQSSIHLGRILPSNTVVDLDHPTCLFQENEITSRDRILRFFVISILYIISRDRTVFHSSMVGMTKPRDHVGINELGIRLGGSESV